MPSTHPSTRVEMLCQYLLTTLETDWVLENGTVLPAGTEVMLLPQTTAHSVRVPGGLSLAEAWPSLSRQGHEHPVFQAQLAEYAAQLVRYADRLTRLESWALEQGFTIPAESEGVLS